MEAVIVGEGVAADGGGGGGGVTVCGRNGKWGTDEDLTFS